jgi:hypothetical protein
VDTLDFTYKFDHKIWIENGLIWLAIANYADWHFKCAEMQKTYVKMKILFLSMYLHKLSLISNVYWVISWKHIFRMSIFTYNPYRIISLKIYVCQIKKCTTTQGPHTHTQSVKKWRVWKEILSKNFWTMNVDHEKLVLVRNFRLTLYTNTFLLLKTTIAGDNILWATYSVVEIFMKWGTIVAIDACQKHRSELSSKSFSWYLTLKLLMWVVLIFLIF